MQVIIEVSEKTVSYLAAQIIVSIIVIQVVVIQTGFDALYTLSEVVRQLRVRLVYQKVINESNSKRHYLNFIILLLVVELYRRSNLVYENTSQQGIMVGEDLPRIKSQYIMTLI